MAFQDEWLIDQSYTEIGQQNMSGLYTVKLMLYYLLELI